MPAHSAPRIRLSAAAEHLYLGFQERATHEVSLVAEALVQEFLEHQPQHPAVVMDLASCGTLDSTFAGWLLKLRREISARSGEVVISGCSQSCHTALDVMGLAPLFVFRAEPPPNGVHEVTCTGVDEGNAGAIAFMLHAHEDLAGVNAENQRVFAPVTELLRRELARKQT